MGSEHAIPEDLWQWHRTLVNERLGCAIREGIRAEEVIPLIERIAALETQVEVFRELLKRLRGYSVIMDIEWSEDWDEVFKRIVQRVQANNHLGKLAAERYDHILELEAQVAALSKPQNILHARMAIRAARLKEQK